MIRSAGGWSVVKALRKSSARIKGYERILGDGDFVESRPIGSTHLPYLAFKITAAEP